VRKVLGSKRKNIVAQFLIETFTQTFIAVCLSILLIQPVLSAFSLYIPNGVEFEMFDSSTLFFILLITLVATAFAGFYPAKILSSHLPALTLKGIGGFRNYSKEYLRKGLIVFQFTISLIFITGAIVIGDQIRFMQKEFKFTKGTVISLWGGDNHNAKILADKIKQLAGVNKVALQGFPPLGMARMIRGMKTKGKFENAIGVSMKIGNEDFSSLYDFKLLAGRNLQPADSLREFVINRSYSKVMGFANPDEALGQIVFLDEKPIPVVGVVEDFHEGSFHEAIGPMVIGNDPKNENNIVLKVNAHEGQPYDLPTILSEVGKQWKQIYPDRPFNYSILDDDIARLYDKEERAAKLMNAVMLITIFISCIGVFGLSMFSAQARTKEIGIRKVLGATVSNIVGMLSNEFILLILIAIFISSPLAWYFMNNWLQDFAYHIDISWLVFVISGLTAMAIALVTVSFQSVRAALANPVNSLRSE
jgi:putative ABC transport system permease protein